MKITQSLFIIKQFTILAILWDMGRSDFVKNEQTIIRETVNLILKIK